MVVESKGYFFLVGAHPKSQQAKKYKCYHRRHEPGFTPCGAWSFDGSANQCYLHSVDACCDQLEKQEASSTWISGYYCPVCWSTKNYCPCSVAKRAKKSSPAFVASGQRATNTSPTVSQTI